MNRSDYMKDYREKRKEQHGYIVYGFVCAKTKKILYIGEGTYDRAMRSLESRLKQHPHFYKIFKKTKNKDVIQIFFRSGLSKTQAVMLEGFLVHRYKPIGNAEVHQ